MTTDELAVEYLNKCHKFLKMGDYYTLEKKNYEQALEEYAQSLDSQRSYFSLINYTFNQIRWELDDQGLSLQLNSLFIMSQIIWGIGFCYEKKKEYKKKAVFCENLKEIFEILGKFKSNFDVKNLKQYEDLSERVTICEIGLEVGIIKASLAEGGTEVTNDYDATFENLCSEFNKSCSYEMCLLPSREVISSSSSSCFIATAAYSTSTHPDIETFRNFRDKKLLTNPVGQVLVSLYYKISPSVANYVKRQPVIKSFLRQQLERLAEWMRSREVKS